MKDIITPPSTTLINLTDFISRRLNLSTLPFHIHQVVGVYLFYHFLYAIAPFLSRLVVPSQYNALSREKKISWRVRVVSQFQNTLVVGCTLYLLHFDEERKRMDWPSRIWTYSPSSGMVQAFAGGYFL